MVRALLAALHLVDDEPPPPAPVRGILIECPDGLTVYRDEDGYPLRGVEFDEKGEPIAGGQYIACGRQVLENGRCPRCGGQSWVPAGRLYEARNADEESPE